MGRKRTNKGSIHFRAHKKLVDAYAKIQNFPHAQFEEFAAKLLKIDVKEEADLSEKNEEIRLQEKKVLMMRKKFSWEQNLLTDMKEELEDLKKGRK